MAPGYSALNLRATPARLPEPSEIVNQYYNLFGLTPLWSDPFKEETFFCSKGIGAGPVLISRATLIAPSHRTMQFDSIRITSPQPEFFFRLDYSCLQTGACLVPPLYGT